jgi:CO dehydrogenase maturation factor
MSADATRPDGRTLRVVFVGKGGAGKSTLSGTVARLLAQMGERVLALDSDPMPGLAVSLGLTPGDEGLPPEAVVESDEPPRFSLALDADGAVERYALRGPDGVRYLQIPKAGTVGPPVVAAQWGFRRIGESVGEDWHVVGDLPAGTRQAFLGWAGYARDALVVASPSPASLLSARRLGRLSLLERAPRLGLIANRLREGDDADALAARTGLPLAAAVPEDPAVAEAERRGVPLVEVAPHGPAVAAMRGLAERLCDGWRPGAHALDAQV